MCFGFRIISTDLGLYFGRKKQINELSDNVAKVGIDNYDWSDPAERSTLRS